MISRGVVDKFGKALSSQDSARQYPKNPGNNGTVVREGIVTASPGAVTVTVSIGGGSPVPIRYIGPAPALGAKVLIVVLGQMIYCLGATSDATTTASPVKVETCRSTNQVIGTSIATGVIFNTNLSTDPFGMVNNANGVITFKVPGDYLVCSSSTFNFSAPASGSQYFVDLYKNGIPYKRGEQGSWVTGNITTPSIVISSIIFNCIVGDTMQIALTQGTGASQGLFTGSGQFNWCQVKRMS